MKNIILTLSAFLLVGTLDAQIIIDYEVPGNATRIITAPEYVRMIPGFSYKPEANNYFKAYIDEDASSILPYTYQKYIDPETRELDFNLPVGSTPGMASVSLTGAATYTIPIFCPPGTAGMQPSLSLVYNSQSGNGIAGYGWNISGLSAITRLSQTLHHDGTTKGVNFINDRFALDGQRLYCKAGNYGEDLSEYYTEVFNGSKIVAHGSTGLENPEWFEVISKDGTIMEYGKTVDSKLTNQMETHDVIAWNLNKIIDPNGNYILFRYYSLGMENVIREILYTGNDQLIIDPYNSIKFYYSEREDVSTSFVGGSRVEQTLLLHHIDICSEGEQIKTYKTNYYLDFHSMLNEFEEYGKNNEKYNATLFGYDLNDKEIIKYDHESSIPNWSDDEILYADFNNDGLSDIFYKNHVGKDSWAVFLNNGNGFYEYPNWAGEFDKRQIEVYSGDFNGDGLTDIIYTKRWLKNITGNDDYCSVNCLINNGSGFNDHLIIDSFILDSDDEYIDISVFDMDGDAKDDFLLNYCFRSDLTEFKHLLKKFEISEQNGIVSAVSLGNMLSIINNVSDYHFPKIKSLNPGNFSNNNGVELLIQYKDIDKTQLYSMEPQELSMEPQGLLYDGGFPSKYHDIFVGDFNGDGISDIVTHVVDVNNNRGWGLNYLIEHPHSTPYFLEIMLDLGNKAPKIAIGDYNKDGKNDLAFAYSGLEGNNGDNSLYLKLFYSTGNNLIYAELLKIYETNLLGLMAFAESPFGRINDFNGDGISDIPVTSNLTMHNIIIVNPEERKTSLSLVSNGFDKKTKFKYTGLANKNVYSSINSSSYPYRDYPFFFDVVNECSTSNGVGGYSNQSYKYVSGVAHLTGKGFLGFTKIVTTDNNSGVIVNSLSEIDYENVFMKPISSFTTTLDGKYLSTQSYTYEFASIYQAPTGVISPYVALTNTLDRFTGTRTISESNYDQFANLTLSVNSIYQTAIPTAIEIQSTSFFNFVSAGGWCPVRPLDQTNTITRKDEPPFTSRKQFSYTPNGNTETIINFYQQDSAIITTYSNYVAGLPKTIRMHVMAHDHNAYDRVINTSYDNKCRFAESVTDAMGYTSSAKFEPGFGNKLEITDVNGLKTYILYDGFGHAVESHNHLGIWAKTESYWKKTTDNVLYYLESTSNNAPYKQEYYDLLGRSLYSFAENPDGNVVCVKTEYDPKGRVISVSEPYYNGNQPSQFTTTQYDIYNRPWITTLPTGVVITKTLPMAGSYSLEVSSHNSGTSITTHQTIDASGKTNSVTDPGGALFYSYYSHGNLKSITAPDGNIFSMQYDEYGRQKSLTDPDAGTIYYNYNAFGELISQTDANLNSFEMVYDNAGRLMKKKCTRTDFNTLLTNTWHPSNAPAGSRGMIQKTEYTDENNNYSFYEYTYNNISQNTHTRITSDRIFNYFYTYDSKGNPDEYIYPSGFTIKNEYKTDKGTLKKVIDKSTNTIVYEPFYNARGQLYQIALNNSQLVTTIGYDPYGLPTYRMTGYYDYLSNEIQHLETRFDQLTGNLIWRRDQNRSLTEIFTYDEVHKNRLATWQVQGQMLYSSSYDDANGNILTKTDFTSPGNMYTYGLDAGPHAVTSVVAPLLLPAEAEQIIKYNSFNKASQITHNEQKKLFLYYGPGGQRIKTEQTVNDQTILTKYFPGGGIEIEVSATGEERWLHYLPGGGLYVCDKDFNKIGMYYVLSDYLGSWDKVINEDGTTIEEYSFDPWGRRRNSTNWSYDGIPSNFKFDRGYTGHEMLDDFGLVNMNGRMYDPVLGRMLSPDNFVSSPGSTQAFNRYSYALNNPLIYTDPSGDLPFLAIAAFAAYQGFVAGHMAKDGKQGFVGGFARGFASGMVSGGVGKLIGPVIGVKELVPKMLTAGINSAVAGGITYGFDALINNSSFNWKGYGLNVATSMLLAGLTYTKPTSQLQEYALGDFDWKLPRGGMSFTDPPWGRWGFDYRGAMLYINTVAEITASSAPKLDIQTTSNLLNGADYLSGVTASAQLSMLTYRKTQPIMNKIGTFSRFSSIYGGLGVVSKISGRVGYVGGGLGTYLDYKSMQSGEIGIGRFGYRTGSFAAAIYAGAAIGGPWGVVGGAAVGGISIGSEYIYDNMLQPLWREVNYQIYNFENALKNGWYPGN